MRRGLLMTLLVGLAGCFDPEPGAYSCTDDTTCPDSWYCHSDQRCRPDPEGAVDLGSIDMELADMAAPDMDVDMAAPDMDVADACVPGSQRPVDLLFVIDDSGSMIEEQQRLRAGARNLLEALAFGRGADGTSGAFTPVEDLHVGVVTTDIGANDALPGPDCSLPGDNGHLISEVRNGGAGCPSTFSEPYLTFDPSVGFNALADDLACLASVGVMGCGFEQQLEAMARALTPSGVTGIDGQADGANAGFLRPNSVVVVALISDESDCSARDLDLFVVSHPTYSTGEYGNLNLRCAGFPDALHPVGRYVDVLLTHLRGTRNTDVVFAPLVGVAPALVGEDWGDILAAPSQQIAIADDGIQLERACESEGTQAHPGRRFIQLAQLLEEQGGHATLGSICQDDYASYFAGILAEVEPLLTADTCD